MIVSTLSRTDPTPSTPFVCCDLAHALNLSVPGRGLPCLGLVATKYAYLRAGLSQIFKLGVEAGVHGIAQGSV